MCIAGARDRTLTCWNIPASENKSPVCINNAHYGWIWGLTAIDDTVYSCSWDETVKSWTLVNSGLVPYTVYEMYAITSCRFLRCANRKADERDEREENLRFYPNCSNADRYFHLFHWRSGKESVLNIILILLIIKILIYYIFYLLFGPEWLAPQWE